MKCFSIVLMLLLDILPKIKKQVVFLQNFLTSPIIICFYFNGPNTVTTFAWIYVLRPAQVLVLFGDTSQGPRGFYCSKVFIECKIFELHWSMQAHENI